MVWHRHDLHVLNAVPQRGKISDSRPDPKVYALSLALFAIQPAAAITMKTAANVTSAGAESPSSTLMSLRRVCACVMGTHVATNVPRIPYLR
jgi:hypothetical protein